jgi:glucosamine--fructose-6-phosphate aminotransferase (isomerizing)
VFAISQSGETADTIEAASLLKSLGAKIFAITNAPRSAITRIANCVLPICAGNEICVAATKSYCGQLACLYLVGSAIKGNLAECKQNLFDCAKKQDLVIYGECGIKELAKLCVNSKAVFFLGREQDYAVAVEGSLKLKEVSYIFSDAYPAGELKHGTLALIDEHTISIIIITKSNIAEKSLNAVEEILSRKGNVAVITTLSWVADTLKKRIKNVIFLTNCNQDYSPFITSSALQLLAYFSAVELGRNPDKPRNLAKSVTVE